MNTPSPLPQRVTPERPYVISWQAYGGHRMYVGALVDMQGAPHAGATAEMNDAAGFPSAEGAAEAAKVWGFDGPWLLFEPYRGQLRLF